MNKCYCIMRHKLSSTQVAWLNQAGYEPVELGDMDAFSTSTSALDSIAYPEPKSRLENPVFLTVHPFLFTKCLQVTGGCLSFETDSRKNEETGKFDFIPVKLHEIRIDADQMGWHNVREKILVEDS